MRYFRIVSFSGIETHRDDADRGSLRLVEGCIPHGQGGLRSAPVWESLGDYGDMSSGSENSINGADDNEGNSLLLVSRDNEVHDLALRSKDNAPLLELGDIYPIIDDDTFLEEKCVLSSVGNNTYAFGDGSKDALFISEDGATQDSSEMYKQKPDYEEYAHEWSKFPKCTFISFKHKNIYNLLKLKNNLKVGLSFAPPTSIKTIVKKSNNKKINCLIMDKFYLKSKSIQNLKIKKYFYTVKTKLEFKKLNKNNNLIFENL